MLPIQPTQPIHLTTYRDFLYYMFTVFLYYILIYIIIGRTEIYKNLTKFDSK